MMRFADTPPRLLTLIMLSGLSVLSLNMFVPSLANMAVDFDVDYSLVSVSIGGYLAVTAVLQVVIGPLSDRFGRRPVLLAGLAVFTGASLACALTTSVWVFLASRMLQGAVISGWALSLAIIRDTAPPQEAASLMGYVSMGMAVAPMLGPLLGGGLDELFGWRASFLAYFALGAVLLVVCVVDLGETAAPGPSTAGSLPGAWSCLLRSGLFWGYALCMALSTGAFYSFIAGAPLVASAVLGLSPALLGVGVGSITAGFMLGSFLCGRVARRYALTTMMIAGRVVACAGLVAGLVLLLAGVVHAGVFFGAAVFVGIGNGLTAPAGNAGALSVNPALAGSAAGVSGALTVGGGALVTTLTGAVLTGANAAPALLALMLLSSLLALAAAMLVRRAERRAGRERPGVALAREDLAP